MWKTLKELWPTWWAVARHNVDPKFVAKRITDPQGVGDTVHNLLEWLGIGRRVRSYFASIQQDCGCERRRRWLNVHFQPWVWWLYPIKANRERPFLTFALPHKNDWEGVWSTVNALVKDCLTTGILDFVEIVIVDQGARGPDGKPIDELFEMRDAKGQRYTQKVRASELVENLASHFKGLVRVVSYTETEGPSGATNAIFLPLALAIENGQRMLGVLDSQRRATAARGEWVMRLDCHVELDPGALRRTWRYIVRHRFSHDIYTGPHRMAVGHGPLKTHTDMEWSGQMLGRWAHDPRGDHPDNLPFPIDNLSGGMVLCRRDAWIPYHPLNVGFGAGQGAIGLKVRRRGDRLLCLPALVWIHRFGRSVSMPLRNDSDERVANYAREFLMIGAMDQIERMRVYYVETEEKGRDGKVKKSKWPAERFDTIVAKSIVEHENWKAQTDPNGVERVFRANVAKKSDLNEHLVTLRRLASQCEHVTEFAHTYQTSTLAFLAGGVSTLINISPRECPGCQQNFIDKIRGSSEFHHYTADSAAIAPIEPTDLLFIDSQHNAKQLRRELALHAASVRTWIVLHDTAKFGQRGDDKAEGLLIALDEFLRAHPEWAIVERYENNHGLIVIERRAGSCLPSGVNNEIGRQEPALHLERQEVFA